MKNIPKKMDAIMRAKSDFINKMRTRFERTVLRGQERFFEKVIAEIISQIELENGVILMTAKNAEIINSIDSIYNDWLKGDGKKIVDEISKTLGEIGTLNESYFGALATVENIKGQFAAVVKQSREIMAARLGLKAGTGEVITNGYVDTLLQGQAVRDVVKQYVVKASAANLPLKTFTEGLRETVVGTDTTLGAFERYYKQFAYDTMQQYDRAYSNTLATGLGLRAFRYQGGLIEDSRDFCVEHNGRIYTVEEAQTWRTWTPSRAVNSTPKSKNPGEVPGYLQIPGYHPLIDCGGYNCRHFIQFISDEMAIEERPDLADVLSSGE